MSKLTDQLAEVRIHNPHNLASVGQRLGGSGVYVNYRTEERGRAFRSAAWQVVDVQRTTDRDEHWQNQGNKTFTVYNRADKDTQREAAVVWAAAYTKTDPAEWVTGPYRGTLVLKSDRKLVLDRLKAKADA